MTEYNGLKVYDNDAPSREALVAKLEREGNKDFEIVECLVKQSNRMGTNYYFVKRLAARFQSGSISTFRVMRNGAIQSDRGFASDWKRLVILSEEVK